MKSQSCVGRLPVVTLLIILVFSITSFASLASEDATFGLTKSQTLNKPTSGQMIDAGKEKLRGEQQVPGKLVRFKVTAFNKDSPSNRPQPIEGATVKVTLWAKGGGTYRGTTNENGEALVEAPRLTDRKYTIEISATGGIFPFTYSRFATEKQEITLSETDTRLEVPVNFAMTVGPDTIKINVHVTRGERQGLRAIVDTSEPVAGATVRVRDRDSLGTKYIGEAITDGNGDARLSVVKLPGATYILEISKEQFKRETTGLRFRSNEKQTEFEKKVMLTKTPGVMAKVTVRSQEDGNGVREASVVFDAVGDYVTGSTDASGVANIFLSESGKYNVRVTHGQFEPAVPQLRDVNITRDQTIELDFELTPKPKAAKSQVTLNVSVTKCLKWDATTLKCRAAYDERRRLHPISGARVSVGSSSAYTDSEGMVRFPLTGVVQGDSVQITAKADGYRQQTWSVRFDVEVVTRNVSDKSAAVALIPGEDSVAEETPIQLTVFVADSAKSDTPIAGASVSLKLMDGRILQTGQTDAQGLANFTIEDSANVPLKLARKGLMADVTPLPASGYTRKPSDWIGEDLLRPSADRRTPKRFIVYLDRDWTAATNAVAALEARVAAWNNDASVAHGKSQSLNRLAAAAPAGRGRAESWLNELKDAKNHFDARLPANSCQVAIQQREAITTFQRDARQKEYAIKMELDQALALAKTCASSQEADMISFKHKKAIRLAGEIGVLEKKAVEANRILSRYAKAVKEGAALSRGVQSNVDKIQDELTSAKKAAETAELDFNRALTLSSNLTARRDALITEIAAARATHELDKFSTGIPMALARRLDNSQSILLKSNNTLGFPHDPDADRRQIVRDTVSTIQNYYDQAAALASQFKNAICDVGDVDAVVQDMGAITTGVTIELGAAANLPNQVAECVKRGACTPIVNEIRSLLQQGNIDLAESKFNQARAQGCDLAALPGGVGLRDEIEYYKTIRDAAAVLKVLSSQCKFQEAQAYVQRMPPSTLNKPLLADAVRDIQTGLEAQRRVEQFLNRSFQATNAGRPDDADQSFTAAQNAAAPYACLVKRVNDLRPPRPRRDSAALGSPVRSKPKVEPLPDDVEDRIDNAANRPKKPVKRGDRPTVEDLPTDVDKRGKTGPAKQKPAVEDLPGDRSGKSGSTARQQPSGLERIAGTWSGTFKRNDTGQTGGASTVFSLKNGKLTGWHYTGNWVMENVTVSGNTVTFSHVYGADCRAQHRFTILNFESRQAQSNYTVTCRTSRGHTGVIVYGK